VFCFGRGGFFAFRAPGRYEGLLCKAKFAPALPLRPCSQPDWKNANASAMAP